MYIKTVVIDGFKSYAQRTEISGFDPMFNAITGLNGSGKSNILDSICFLLGISNLSQVRASNLQDLVYKSGQAGITKATVSITFDNRDKNQSPLGYDQYEEIIVTRQVVIGGRNKYLINGSNANNTRVQDLFRSVQLNVNNPHFLIMQGRITKVLNMKPPEILSMIEEAAGTRLYESKRETAQKTIEKKDGKLQEIDAILKEEITPTLTKLKEERSAYLEYQKIMRELEHLNKLYIAYKFVCAEDMKNRSVEELQTMHDSIKELQQKQKEIDDQMKNIEKVIEELEKKRDDEAGGTMQQLEAALVEKKKEDAQAQNNHKHKKEALKAEEKKKKEIIKNMDGNKTAMGNKAKELEKQEKAFHKLEEQGKQSQEAHTAAQEHFHAVSAGLSKNADGEDASLQAQLMDAKRAISQAETETKQSQIKLKHAKEEVKKKQAELKKTDQSYQKDKAGSESVRKNLEKLQAELKNLSYSEDCEEKLQGQRRHLVKECHDLQEKVDVLEAKFPQLHFQYRDPEKNFDRRKVHGLVANLIKVKEPTTATALEVVAGGKLYNVVVDTEQTGKKLLQKGELKRRYTIIPLNKIAARSINPDAVRRAESLVGKQNVHTALSLVGYESDLRAAMEFVFGSSFVCPDMNTAKKVTYDEKVMKKTVTLEGDVFDPAGTLSGGARRANSSILLKLQELQEAQAALHQKQQQLEQVEKQITSGRKQLERFRQLTEQVDLKTRELQQLEDRLKQSTHHQQLEEVNGLQESIKEQEEVFQKAQETEKQASKRVKELQDKIKNASALREKELKQAEAEVATAKKKMAESNKLMKEKQQEVESIQLEIQELKKELEGYNTQIEAVDEAIAGFQKQVDETKEAAAETTNTVKEAQAALNKQKELLKACNKDISEKQSQLRDLKKEQGTAQIKEQEMQHKVDKCTRDSKDSARTVEQMLQQYDWIADEKQYFGQVNTAYDFKANDPKEAGRRIQKLSETKDKLAKNVNMRAMNMLGKAEEQYQDLMRKRKIVLADKAKIADVIAELDAKKNQALRKAHTRVNEDFGSIFSTLLPGTNAKLMAPEGQTILDGLEFKIAFGDVWKESLSELSGGQRSLVALSLILALLLFKPAPLYILDEVDAALDLSHTQNIGQMLRTHFKHSQFIVVSLKDGMFNNANVLFKTKFVDGVSTVTRYTQHQSTSQHHSATASEKSSRKKNDGAKRPRLVDPV